VDQDHWLVNDNNDGYETFFGLQQEFRPTLPVIDTVQFSIAQGLMHPAFIYPGSAAVNLREGGVEGPIIASSAPVGIPARYVGSIVFHFYDPVPLTPGIPEPLPSALLALAVVVAAFGFKDRLGVP
jgi:hypothetical protein